MSSGTLYIVSAPSGAGKSSLLRALLESIGGDLVLSVSHATRTPRPGEVDGKDYHFVDVETFNDMVSQGAFLEHAQVFDNYYGTSRQSVEAQLSAGLDVILEIDWQGAKQVRNNLKDATGIFILPPSKTTLEQRLRNRGQDNEDVISRRMRDAENEISHYVEFDYIIVNDDFEQALTSLSSIIVAQRHSLAIQKNIQADLIAELLAQS